MWDSAPLSFQYQFVKAISAVLGNRVAGRRRPQQGAGVPRSVAWPRGWEHSPMPGCVRVKKKTALFHLFLVLHESSMNSYCTVLQTPELLFLHPLWLAKMLPQPQPCCKAALGKPSGLAQAPGHYARLASRPQQPPLGRQEELVALCTHLCHPWQQRVSKGCLVADALITARHIPNHLRTWKQVWELFCLNHRLCPQLTFLCLQALQLGASPHCCC